jgi:ABC-2 type transport system permease protein
VAVYKQSYQTYTGTLTPVHSRFLILPRYSFRYLFRSRLFMGFFVVCYFCPLIAALLIYLHHNFTALRALGIPAENLVPIVPEFFLIVLSFQASLAFLMTVLVGPGLISPDLSNNALPLYLSRPFTRTQYILGKMSVLAILLSLVMWIPSLLLVALQSSLEGTEWLFSNIRIPVAIFVGSWIWIFTISFLALALSAWVKWRPVAGALLFGVFFGGAGFGASINEILDTRWGSLLNLSKSMEKIWGYLFMGMSSGSRLIPWIPRFREIPLAAALLSLATVWFICLWLLSRKIRAYEVVR